LNGNRKTHIFNPAVFTNSIGETPMKIVVATITFLIMISLAFAGGEKKYGKDLTIKSPTSVSEILSNPGKYNGVSVLVEGTIVDVCAKKGCWIKIAGEKEADVIQIKVEDDVIVFPMEAKGKRVRAQGKVFAKEYSVKELIAGAKHEAEEQKKEFDASSITEPKTVVRINGEGAVIKE
jgi:hypothetical protein